jgi:hypothetical protein
MSVPELFHHQHRFVGCLTIRRLGTTQVLLATQAFDTSDGCSALAEDGRCGIHADRKPLTCQVVPFDALVPDEASHALLAERARDAAFFGADCIVHGRRPDFPVVVRRLRVVDDGFREALARRRADLAEERRIWGDAVFGMLRGELFDDPGAVARLPSDGYFAMAIAPVLMVLGDVSARLRARCIEYLDAQVALIESLAAPSMPRGVRQQLESFAGSGIALRRSLAARARWLLRASEESAAIEAWVGLSHA